jgi:hypothetical protein
MDMVAYVTPAYTDRIQHIGEDEYNYVGIGGNNQITTCGGSGGGSERPATGFVYPRRV